MRSVIALVFLAACSGGDWVGPGPDDEPFSEDIGTAEQSLFLPQPFGGEAGVENGVTNPICSAPWTGGQCRMVSNKTLDIGFEAGTCDAWWQGRVVDGWNEFVNHISGTGFSVTTSGNPKYKVKCVGTSDSACTGGYLGQFLPNVNPTGPTTQLGMIRMYNSGTLKICPSNFVTGAWNNVTDTKRKRAGSNTVKHELFHLSSWGHYQGSGNHIMNEIADLTSSTSSWYTVNYSMPNSMFTAMQCFDPTSDTQPNCPN